MFKVGDVVKFADNWCTEAEKKYRYQVLETGFCGNRLKIGCLNSALTLGSIQVVDEEMVVMA